MIGLAEEEEKGGGVRTKEEETKWLPGVTEAGLPWLQNHNIQEGGVGRRSQRAKPATGM